jgi:hypothetical protein
MEEAFTNDQIRTIPEEESGVVILNGEPYMNVGGRYVLEAEALYLFQHQRVQAEMAKLKKMEDAFKAKAAALNEAESKKVVETPKETVAEVQDVVPEVTNPAV